ncbi:hypothetical protein DFA_01024 [Cavenderia fasciculata]|uniref:Cytochrome b5 heme-binding domain-containing protein n=1 Tax=Cavenderia fasciculata TaxID=261658 RepID=F4PV33_CACFS|nr:uncharacterized protein DFA_01024 [Cavenderia fasciculata]EGG21149.1 hypothetical protein DFA_01024 [Cavenderia fasciculata]|eukprot:XP_004358999.1 hypothetical protein DFA_01024 [Cavenderia fasciculata]
MSSVSEIINLIVSDTTNLLVALIALGVVVYTIYGIMSVPKEEPKVVKKKSSRVRYDGPTRYFTQEEVARHDKEDDLWLIIDGKVYDLTTYVDQHVGGLAIMRNAGKDSSEGFHGEQHPVKVEQILLEYYIGEFKK